MDLEEAKTKTRGEEEEEEEEGRQHKKRRRMMEEETKPEEEEKEEIKRREKEEKEEDNSARMKEEEEGEKRIKEKKERKEEEGKEEKKRKTNKKEDKSIGKKEKTQENEEKMEKEEEDTQTHAHAPPDHTDTKQTPPAPTNAQTLSKRQLKKQLKRARWLETKEARKKHKRQREKEKAKEHRLQQTQHTPEKVPQLSLALENSPEPPDVPNSSPPVPQTLQCKQDPKVAQLPQNLASPPQAAPNLSQTDPNLAPAPRYTPPVSRRSLKKHSVKMSASPCKLRVAVDLSLAALMNDRRLGQCLRQVARCYSANRRVPAPLQLYVTSFTGRAKSIMSQQAGFENWDVHFQPESYLSKFAQSDIVYLTSESTHTLQTLDQTKVYIIGGLVDHNKLKGHCYELAKDHKLATARLPIDCYLDMRTRKVLTIDQVFRILLGVAGGGRWREVLLSVLPARKGAKGKEEEEEEEKEEKGDDVENVEVKREKVKKEEEEKGNDIQNKNMKREKKEGKEEEEEEEVDHILLKE